MQDLLHSTYLGNIAWKDRVGIARPSSDRKLSWFSLPTGDKLVPTRHRSLGCYKLD
jgi:hypothetical protein